MPRANAALLVAAWLFCVALPWRSPEPAPTPAPGGVRGAARLLYGLPLDPNQAPATALEALAGIGPGRAAAIVAARQEAPFCSVEALLRVRGIGPRTLARVAPQLAVETGACTASTR